MLGLPNHGHPPPFETVRGIGMKIPRLARLAASMEVGEQPNPRPHETRTQSRADEMLMPPAKNAALRRPTTGTFALVFRRLVEPSGR
jgi:hypothetical protein